MENTIFNLILFSTLLPLASSLIVIFFGKGLMGKKAGVFATAAMGVSFLLSLAACFTWFGADNPQTVVRAIPWIPVPGTEAGWLYLGLLYDDLTAALMVMVTMIATLVHLYSIGYMAGDKRYERFFAYLSLFTFSMLGIITANGIMQLFVFWELVGLSSYLLIGFWFEKRGPQLACKKAFVMNRIGDTGFLVGFGILFHQLGAKVLLPGAGSDGGMFVGLADAIGGAEVIVNNPPMWLTVAGIGLFFGAMGKSAQFPLHTWLPDAMEGPTPVSSIVHSATMVAAGVYLTARIYPILTPGAHLFVCTIGLITLVMAAIMAMVMTDIKRVLAYSTLSQLGYMILGVGSGAYIFALFHLITHAFFKCCLFQCSGSVINAAHHQQDMTYYGGLGKKMPLTMLAYGICTLAIAGAAIPFTTLGLSGFYSKDGIIAGTYLYGEAIGGYGWLFYWGPVIVAYITPFYMARSFALTFLGKPRDQHLYDHAQEQPWTMTVPQLVLAFMAIVSGWFFWKGSIVSTQVDMAEMMTSYANASWVPSYDEIHHAEHHVHTVLLHGFTWILMIGLGIFMYKDGFTIASKIAAIPGIKQLHCWAKNKFYFDALNDIFIVAFTKAVAGFIAGFDRIVVDGLVNLVAYIMRGIGWGVGLFDNKVVDGAVNGAATVAQGGGQALRATQAGRIRGYVLLMIATAVAITLIVIVVANVIGS